jgi:hypothetical protein
VRRPSSLAFVAAAAALTAAIAAFGQSKPSHRSWRSVFPVRLSELRTIGRNEYFILEPGYRLTLEGLEDAKPVRLMVSVLDETRRVAGVETRIVEERETQGDELAEVSRNYLAIDGVTGDVYYFGEEVDIYEGGKLARHEGAWQHGESGARFGLMMPGKPRVGLRYYQEMAPRVAMDRAEIVSLTAAVKTPGGRFDRCLKTRESSPLEPGTREFKTYAPGVGLVQDGALLLTERTPAR